MRSVMIMAFKIVNIEYNLSAALISVAIAFSIRAIIGIAQEIYISRLVANMMLDIKCGIVERIAKADYLSVSSLGLGHLTNEIGRASCRERV